MKRERGPYRYRRMQMLDGASADAYRPGRKPSGPVCCVTCNAVFKRGRWSWAAQPPGAARVRCPACRRIEERMPAGYITISGGFAQDRRSEIIASVSHCEANEKSSHPLERIMAIEGRASDAVITTTSAHLAHRIGHALQRAFKGNLSQSYGSDGVLRVRWRRDA